MASESKLKEQNSQKLQRGCDNVADDIDIIDISEDCHDCLTAKSDSCNDEASVSDNQMTCLLCGEACPTFTGLKKHLLSHSCKAHKSGVCQTGVSDTSKITQLKKIYDADTNPLIRSEEKIFLSESSHSLKDSGDSQRDHEAEASCPDNLRSTSTDALSWFLKDSEPSAQQPQPLNSLCGPGIEKFSPSPTANLNATATTSATRLLPEKQVSFKPYSCPICYKGLSKNYVRTHMKLHNREKLFQCKFCDKSFAVKNYLSRHIKKVHKGLDPQDSLVSGNMLVSFSDSNNNDYVVKKRKQDYEVPLVSKMKASALSLLQIDLSGVQNVLIHSCSDGNKRNQVSDDNDSYESRKNPENEVLFLSENEGNVFGNDNQASGEMCKVKGFNAVDVEKKEKLKTQKSPFNKSSQGSGKKKKSLDAPACRSSHERGTLLERNHGIKCCMKPKKSVDAPFITILD